MSQRADYTDDEWFTLWRSTANVPTAMMVAHPAHLAREAFAADGALAHVAKHTMLPLIKMLFAPPKQEAQWLSHRLDILRRAGGQSDADLFMNESLEECSQAVAVLAQRGSTEEVAAYQHALFEVALSVAKAGKEGEILGFGGVRLDESEKIFLRDLAEVLTITWNET